MFYHGIIGGGSSPVEPVNTGIVRNFTVTDGSATTIDVGFKPSHVLVWTMSSNNAYVYYYNYWISNCYVLCYGLVC